MLPFFYMKKGNICIYRLIWKHTFSGRFFYTMSTF